MSLVETPELKPDERWSWWSLVVRVTLGLSLLVLVANLAVPPLSHEQRLLRGLMAQTISNARQIYLAELSMAEDGRSERDPRRAWPGDLAREEREPIDSLSAYVERLVELEYLKRGDLGKLFGAHGIPAYQGTGPFSGENSALKIYRIGEKDDPNCIAIATRNFRFASGLDAKQAPYADKGFSIVRKSGQAVPFFNKQSALNKRLGFMPGHHSDADPGLEIAESILKL